MIREAATNFAAATVRHTRRSKKYVLIGIGALNVAGGALMAAAPHLQTVLTPTRFAVVMIVTGVVTATLAFVSTQLQEEA